MNNEAQYTVLLYEVVEDYGYKLFDFPYTLPDVVNKEGLELAFYQHFYFREISEETIDRWLLRMQFKWLELCKKYSKLFEIFNREFTKEDVLDNNDLSNVYNSVFSDTPQSTLDELTDYATNKTKTSSTTKGNSGEHKYKLLSDYANKLRIIEQEMIEDCEPLFMQLF